MHGTGPDPHYSTMVQEEVTPVAKAMHVLHTEPLNVSFFIFKQPN